MADPTAFHDVRVGLLFGAAVRYLKPYLTPNQQVALLTSRGMQISDPKKAESCLARIGYYRLSAYWYPFRASELHTNASGKKQTLIKDNFKDNTHFSTILELYVFDKKLRMIVLDALERIEVAVRTDIALLLGKYDPLAHRNPALLHGNFSKPSNRSSGITKHADWLARLDDKFLTSKEDFSVHFRNKYAGEHLPIWIAVELLDFGTLSHFYSGMKYTDKEILAKQYNIPTGEIFETWLRCLNNIRNICAHHSRLWNKPLSAQPKWPMLGTVPECDHLDGDTHGQTRLYAALVVLKVLLKTVNPSTSWVRRLTEHIATLPTNPHINLQSAGFPTGWQKLSLWKWNKQESYKNFCGGGKKKLVMIFQKLVSVLNNQS